MTSRPSPGSSTTYSQVPPQVQRDIERCGYYPDVVMSLVGAMLMDEEVVAHLAHTETLFDTADSIKRHITALALTPTRLLVTHADDHPGTPGAEGPFAASALESVPLRSVHSAVLATVIKDPETNRPDWTPDEVTVTICWGTVTRIELEPASCPEKECPLDHGYTGSATRDDIVVRISAVADGPEAVRNAIKFVATLNRRLGAGPA